MIGVDQSCDDGSSVGGGSEGETGSSDSRIRRVKDRAQDFGKCFSALGFRYLDIFTTVAVGCELLSSDNAQQRHHGRITLGILVISLMVQGSITYGTDQGAVATIVTLLGGKRGLDVHKVVNRKLYGSSAGLQKVDAELALVMTKTFEVTPYLLYKI